VLGKGRVRVKYSWRESERERGGGLEAKVLRKMVGGLWCRGKEDMKMLWGRRRGSWS
jgi:hypothetical protein